MATSISSGAMQERANFRAMILFSCFNILCFAFPAHWMWSDIGFLKNLGAIDCAGSGSIHIAGGFSGMLNNYAKIKNKKRCSFWYAFFSGALGAYLLKPRIGYKGQNERIAMGNAKNSCAGLFMIWWGTQAFNSGR